MKICSVTEVCSLYFKLCNEDLQISGTFNQSTQAVPPIILY